MKGCLENTLLVACPFIKFERFSVKRAAEKKGDRLGKG